MAFERFVDTTILSFDVSSELEKALKSRCSQKVESKQLQNFLLNDNPKFFLGTIHEKGLNGKIDAMVHVDPHTLFVYWASAAIVLRVGVFWL